MGTFTVFLNMTVDRAARLDLAYTILKYIPSDIFAQNVYSFFAPAPEALQIAELPAFMGFSAIWT